MLHAIEAILEPDVHLRLLPEVRPSGSRRAPVTVLDAPGDEASEISTALLSESALSEDWNRPEEDAAWAHLQPEARSSTMFTVVSSRHSTLTEEP